MADNVQANSGSGGATFATDDIGGIHYPISKLGWGPLDTANLVDDASGKRLPVKIADPIVAGTNNIGDVDIVTVPAPLSTTGGGTEATALRVTVATDSTGVLSVDDNGGSLTVDGSVSITGTATVDTELPSAAALADAASATPTTPTIGVVPLVMNATTVDRARAVVDGLNSVGTGIQAVGITGQLDDSATSAVTENQFATVRISARRALLSEGSLAHDAAGSAVLPLAVGGFASAAAPTDVNADTDIVRAWFLRNGARACVLTAAGALIGGDAPNGLDVDVTRVTGTVTTQETRPATGTISSVAGSATSVTLLASNANRRGATIYNDSTAILYVKYGATASTSSFTVKVFSEGFHVLPFPSYTGIIDGIWASATGNARITETT